MSLSYKKELSKLNIDENKNYNEEHNNNNINDINNIKKVSNICLYTRKMNEEEVAKGDITNLIHKSFNDPDYYFSIENPVNVGKKIKLIKFDLSVPKGKKRASHLKPQTKSNINLTKVSMTETNKSTSFGKQKQTDSTNVNNNKYEFINNNALKNIFENFKLKNKNNKKLGNNEISLSRNLSNNLNKSCSKNIINDDDEKKENNIYPYDLCRSLDYQNKQMYAKEKRERKVIKLSKYISKKINKDEEDLLINKVDLFKYKKEILKEINEEKPKEEKFGKFQWNMDLRRPVNFKGLRQLHINVNSQRNPFWGVIVERCPEQKETAIRPGYNLHQKEFEKFAKNQIIQKNKNCLDNIKNFDDLNVNGSNLLDLEYKREMSSKGRKILHKVFIENGKTILDKDINQVFGEETIYKNYENKNKYSYNDNNNNSLNTNNENNNIHYKFNQKGKKSRIVSSISRSLEKSGSYSNLFNNAQNLHTEF